MQPRALRLVPIFRTVRGRYVLALQNGAHLVPVCVADKSADCRPVSESTSGRPSRCRTNALVPAAGTWLHAATVWTVTYSASRHHWPCSDTLVDRVTHQLSFDLLDARVRGEQHGHHVSTMDDIHFANSL